MYRREFLAAPALALAGVAQQRPRLRRAASFFGLHFDLHPNEKDTVLGRDVSEAMVDSLLARVRPDYVQYDAKGHPGWLGWPRSEVGPSAPGIVQDSLAIWRKVTLRHGVALYIHFSGVWDSSAVARHQEWARVGPDGKPDTRQASLFGPYADKLMIPQLREAALRYFLDGVWVDGECWATNPDYSAAAAAAWKTATGRDALPNGKDDPYWLEFLEFNRAAFRRHVEHYANELHKVNPQFQVASNWLYSTFVPEEPGLPVDFLSGDYLGNASISQARLEARYLSMTGKPWDLMAWGFQQANSNAIGYIHKPAVQLQQEASVVLAQGGGFQVYYVPSRAGHFEASHVDTMAELAAFCRARQAVSFQSETVPQVGVVFSKETLYATGNKLFGGWGKLSDPARGWVDLLLGCQLSVDVLPDWKLDRLLAAYPLVVLPEWTAVSEATLNRLLDYARAGGTLLVAGAANAARLAGAAGFLVKGSAADQPAFLAGGGVLGNARGMWQDLEPGAAQVLERRFSELDSRAQGKPAALEAALDKGKLLVVPGPLGIVYAETHAPAIRRFAGRLCGALFEPLVRVTAPPVVEVVLRRKTGKLRVHLLNTAGMQVAGNYAAIDYVPEAGPVRLAWKARGAASPAVTLDPAGAPLTVTRRGADWQVVLPRLAIHAVVTIA